MSETRRTLLKNLNLHDENSIISLCRICLEDGARIPIFEIDDEENYDTLTKLSLCLREKIEDIDGYPRFLCNVCSDILDSAYNFINKYKDTCKILQSGIDILKQDTEVPIIENGLVDEEIKVDNIKTEIQDSRTDNSDDDFSDEDKEFLVPLKLKVKLKEENETKPVRKTRNHTSTNTKQVTNKIASSILEGQFAWNGDKWCLQSNALKLAKQKLKLLTEIKAEPVKKKRIKIEVPKVKVAKPDPPKLCDVCGEVFKNQEKLWSHKRKVHYKKAMQCPHCGKMLASQYYLNRHIKRKHEESRDYICAACGSGFAYKTELRNHNRSVHEKHLRPKKQYKCKICAKTYKCAKSVVVHERSVHTGQRPAVCSVCDSSFYHIDYLREHMRLHTGETPFKCPICGRGYAQRCNMKSHLRIHRVSELDAITLSKLRPNYLRLLKA
ncbi:zinc finger protein 569-like isoform X1 [Maniola jurtina]|uniref:zinc finger protein 569-like isoform X1 n=1 Tax=Maniola jurtina TaxID=191418 RepID=UPI001E68C9F4|nr:zinc finger protein 569-like isoform X1 [Maniola jurtina]XP_045773559.1 zinc finger protein 569-like isoform X1 [Maniola jurtina]